MPVTPSIGDLVGNDEMVSCIDRRLNVITHQPSTGVNATLKLIQFLNKRQLKSDTPALFVLVIVLGITSTLDTS